MGDRAEELDGLGGDITTALEDIRVPAVLVDTGGIIRWQNEASRRDRGELVGSAVADVVAPEDRELSQELLARILCHGEPAEFTLHVKDASGGIVARDVSAAPVIGGGSVVGMFGLSREVDASAGGTRASRAPSELTARQQDVLHLLAAGRSTREIASALSLSQTTVRNYAAGILAALGVHTRLQAVLAAKGRGLVD